MTSGVKEKKIVLANQIPKPWSLREVQEIATIRTGGKDTQDKNINGLFPFFVRSQTVEKIGTYCYNGEAVLTAGDGVGVGKIYHYINGKFDYHQRVYSISNFSEEVLGMYFYYYFSQHFYKRVYKLSAKNSVDSVRMEMIAKMKISLPPVQEQQKIVEILSTWDEAIEKTQQLIAHLVLRKKGLMQELLTGKKRLPGLDGEWKEAKLGHYFKERKEIGLVNLPLLSVGKNGVYPQDTTEKKDTSNADKSKYKRICPGDIGYNTMRMWQGRSALSDIEGIVSPAYTILEPKENCDSHFFSYLFKLDSVVHKFYRHSQGMVSDTWMCKYKDFAIVRFLAPSGQVEQKAIAEVLRTADEEIDKIKDQLDILRGQKKGLMQQLLTGKIRVKY